MIDPANNLPASGLTPADAELAARIRAGDHQAFREVLIAHFNSAAQICYRLLHSRDAARDAAQRAFATIWEKREDFHPTRSVRNYILSAARNWALQDMRHARVEESHQQAVLGAPDIEESQLTSADAERVENQATLKSLLAGLPDRSRQALELRYLEQLPYADVAQIMGISPGAAEQLVIRALDKLRKGISGAP